MEEKIAIEIETGNSNAMENIEKCLKAGLEFVISVPVDGQAEAQIKHRLRKQMLDKTQRVLVINSHNFEQFLTGVDR